MPGENLMKFFAIVIALIIALLPSMANAQTEDRSGCIAKCNMYPTRSQQVACKSSCPKTSSANPFALPRPPARKGQIGTPRQQPAKTLEESLNEQNKKTEKKLKKSILGLLHSLITRLFLMVLFITLVIKSAPYIHRVITSRIRNKVKPENKLMSYKDESATFDGLYPDGFNPDRK